MRPLAEIESRIEALTAQPGSPAAAAAELLRLGEEVIEHWIAGRGQAPTDETREGFRLLALHRQGAAGEPSFNACRETCRELVYHHNLIQAEPGHAEAPRRAKLAAMVAMHLCLFVGGKMRQAGLGEFCCSSRPLHGQGGGDTIEPSAARN
jgi:hypothetical protein